MLAHIVFKIWPRLIPSEPTARTQELLKPTKSRIYFIGRGCDRIGALYGLLDEDGQNALAHLIDYSECFRSHHWLTIISVLEVIIQMDGGLRLLRMPPFDRAKASKTDVMMP
jgi:hypothetical protein